MRRLHAEGRLDAAQSLILRASRPKEELYDLESDPFELRNLADDTVHSAVLERMRAALADWERRTDDKGRTPESPTRYDSDMAVYLREGNPTVRENIGLMKRWASERPPVP